MTKIPLICALVLLTPLIASAKDALVDAQILADVSAIAPGKPFTLGVKLKMAPGWHVYWMNPGDSGIATSVKLDLPAGFSAGAVQYPTPMRFEMAGGLVSYGYEDEVMLLVPITTATDARVGDDVRISAKVSWLVCQTNCVKGDATVAVALKVDAKPQAANSAIFEKWRGLLPQTTDFVKQETRLDAPGGQFKSATITLTVNWPKAPEKIDWFPATTDQTMVKSSNIKNEGGKTVITAEIDALPGEKITDASFFSVIGYTLDAKRVGLAVPIKLVPSSTGG